MFAVKNKKKKKMKEQQQTEIFFQKRNGKYNEKQKENKKWKSEPNEYVNRLKHRHTFAWYVRLSTSIEYNNNKINKIEIVE